MGKFLSNRSWHNCQYYSGRGRDTLEKSVMLACLRTEYEAVVPAELQC